MQFSKSAAARLTAGLLIVSTLIVPALAVTGTVNSGSTSLRIREQPTTGSTVLTKLDNGAKVDVVSTADNGWYKVVYDGLTGFVSSDYIVLDNTQNAVTAVSAVAPTAVSSAQPAEAATSPVTEPQYGKVTTASLNIRSGAGTDYDKVGSLKSGKVVAILGQTGDWYQVEGGYVSCEFVTIVDAAEAAKANKGQEIADFALSFKGSRYVYGGSSPKGFDCSGFTSYVYSQFGYSIHRTASGQLDNGTSVSMSELQPGDLVFFKKSGTGSKRASHVGVYIGNSQFIHASTAKVGVIISNMSDAYYTTGFVGGRRLA